MTRAVQPDGARLCREAEALRLQGKPAQAVRLLEQALQIDPGSFDAGLILVQALLDQARHDEAAAQLARLTSAHPAQAAPWRMLGLMLWQAGKPSEALAPMRRHADLLPNDAAAQLDLAKLLVELGEWEDALARIRRVGVAGPAGAVARFMEGHALFEGGDTEAAIGAYMDAVRQRPALGEAAGGRVLEAWIMDFRSWANAGGGECRVLAAPQSLNVPQPGVIPASESRLWAARTGQVPEIFIGKLHGAEVFGPEFAVLSSDACLFLDGFVTSPDVFPRKGGGQVKYASSDARVVLDLPHDPIEHDGPCIVLGRPNNHFHFLMECLPRIWSVERYGVARDVPALVPADLYPTSLELLAMFDFPQERLVRVPPGASVRCRTLYAPSLLNRGELLSPLAVQFLRERLLDAAPAVADSPKRVYLSRNRMPRRHVRNEAEILPLLERHGFRTVYPEALGVAEQLRLFAHAEAIVSPDSSALANLAFAAPFAKVGVFSWRGLHVPLWHWIAFLAGAQLTYIHADAIVESNVTLAHRDMRVDPALVEEWLATV